MHLDYRVLEQGMFWQTASPRISQMGKPGAEGAEAAWDH